jgi:hypothetical protein
MENQPNPLEFLGKLMRGEGQEELAQMAGRADGWWSHIDPIMHETNHQRIDEICSGLVIKAAKNNQTCHTITLQRALSGTMDDLVGDLTHDKYGLHLLVKSVSRREAGVNRYRREYGDPGSQVPGDRPTLLFVRGTDSAVYLNFQPRKDTIIVNLQAVSLDGRLIENLRKIFEIHTEEPREEPELNIVSDSHGELDLVPIGRPAVKLVTDNYTPDVVGKFRHIVDQFTSPNPIGRLAILHGEPGTGKTYLLRAFMAECNAKDTSIIFFPPQIFEAVNSPQITRLLLDYATSQAMVLFIEDGDGLLLKRSMDNMNVLASLLSLSDGFLGSLLDIRVFVTTNTRKLDIDKALLRDGRLNQIIEVGTLPPSQAAKVYWRLSGREDWMPDSNVTLAQIYKRVAEEENVQQQN